MSPRNLVALLIAGLIALNAWVMAPVALRMNEDERNSGFTMIAYRTWALHPREITIDLLNISEAAPIDLYRGLFQTAEALDGRTFDRVTLARRGQSIFFMSGSDFATLGAAFRAGQNPVYLIRTLPEKLFRPDGSPAYETWSGGLLGVLGAQMDDVNDAAGEWAGSE